MRIEKKLKQYYQQRLQQMPVLPSPVLPAAPSQHLIFGRFTWDDVIGSLVICVVVAHFLFLGKFFDLFQFLPGLTLIP